MFRSILKDDLRKTEARLDKLKFELKNIESGNMFNIDVSEFDKDDNSIQDNLSPDFSKMKLDFSYLDEVKMDINELNISNK